MDNRHWCALYTRSRHEKSIAAELQKKSVEAFLPLQAIRRKWSDRTVTVEEPLFKSYLFVKTDFLGSREVLKTKGAVTFVNASGYPVPIQESVIGSLKAAVQSGVPLEPFPYIREGDRVYVRAGIFRGMEGFVIRKNDRKCRVVISIDALRASASLEVDAALVENLTN